MKMLTFLVPIVFFFSALSVKAQSVICENNFDFDNPRIIANRVCPLGYVKVEEVGNGPTSGGSSPFQPIYDQINRKAADQQAARDREALAREAQRDREAAAEEAARNREFLAAEAQKQRDVQASNLGSEGSIGSVTNRSLLNLGNGAEVQLACIESEGKTTFAFTIGEPKSTVFTESNGAINKIRVRPNIKYSERDISFEFQTFNTGRVSKRRWTYFHSFVIDKRTLLATVNRSTQIDDGPREDVVVNRTDVCDLEVLYLPETEGLEKNAYRTENLVDSLNNLTKLYEQGLLSDDEFTAAKRRLLGL